MCAVREKRGRNPGSDDGADGGGAGSGGDRRCLVYEDECVYVYRG